MPRASLVLFYGMFSFSLTSFSRAVKNRKRVPEVITTFHNIKSFEALLPLSFMSTVWKHRSGSTILYVRIVWIVNSIFKMKIVLRFTASCWRFFFFFFGLQLSVTTKNVTSMNLFLSFEQWWRIDIVLPATLVPSVNDVYHSHNWTALTMFHTRGSI